MRAATQKAQNRHEAAENENAVRVEATQSPAFCARRHFRHFVDRVCIALYVFYPVFRRRRRFGLILPTSRFCHTLFTDFSLHVQA
jgi:hypothetical protein